MLSLRAKRSNPASHSGIARSGRFTRATHP